MHRTHARNVVVPLAAATLFLGTSLALAACDPGQDEAVPAAPAPPSPPVATPASILVDGSLSEWSDGPDLRADGAYLYLRMRLPEERTLQGGTATTRVLLDLDGSAATGQKTTGTGGDLGVDVEVAFSPPSERRSSGRDAGLRVTAYSAAGPRGRDDADLGHADLDLVAAPTYASKDFEMRVARFCPKDPALDALLASATSAAARIVTLDAKGKPAWTSARIALADLPPRTALPAVAAVVPEKPAGALRIVTWNVEHESPMKNPEPFARILHALAPDVVLVQEWQGDDAALGAWFSNNLPSPEPWRVSAGADLGVAIASRLPARRIGPTKSAPILPEREVNGKMRPVRVVVTEIEAPFGPLLTATTHLKCCGTMDSPEDELRQLEARAIQRFLSEELGRRPDTPVLITGDMNLVGTRTPLDLLRPDLDVDHGELGIVEPYTLEGRGMETWRRDAERFSPGRLDWVLYSDAFLDTAASFVFDTSWLAPSERERLGLRTDDSLCSDHRPVVVDLKKRASSASLTPVDAAGLLERIRSADAPVVLNLWASWCQPCVAELPDLVQVAREYEDRGLRMMLVSCDFEPEQEAAALRILDRLGVRIETFVKSGPDEPFIDAIEPRWDGALPATLVYARGGVQRGFHEGAATADEFRALIARLFDASNGSARSDESENGR